MAMEESKVTKMKKFIIQEKFVGYADITIENLTDKLMVGVANYVTEDPRFTELLNELVPEAIDLELGQVDDYSVVQIITSIQQHLRCSPNHSQIHYPLQSCQ